MALKNIYILFLSLLFLIPGGAGDSDVLLNGTSVYLATGDSYGLYQGYVITIKSVSSDDSIWLQLLEKEIVVKSEIVDVNGHFDYSKNNRTIISIVVNNVYSGSSEEKLVAFYPVYQFVDPDMPAPVRTMEPPQNSSRTGINDQSRKIEPPMETFIWTLGIILTLILFYIIRKLW